MEFYPQSVSLPDLVDGVCRVMSGVAEERGIDLVQDLGSNLEVYLDGPKLKQILYNLVSNAVKFSPQGGIVRVTARMLSTGENGLGVKAVEIVVSDQGIGIREQDQLRIFEEFQQLDNSLSRKTGGTGLGLALVRRFVEQQGGQIEVSSEYGQGSSFTVLLPADTRISGT